MYFYAVFAVALAAARTRATALAVALLVAVLAAVQLSPLGDHPVAYFYGHPIILEFAYGIAAFHIVRAIEARRAARPPAHRPAAAAGEQRLLIAGVAVGLVAIALRHALFARRRAIWPAGSGVRGRRVRGRARAHPWGPDREPLGDPGRRRLVRDVPDPRLRRVRRAPPGARQPSFASASSPASSSRSA